MSSKTYSVSNDAGLMSALSKASGGDTISLKTGEYSVDIHNMNFDSPVTITSADPDAPAVLTDSTLIKNSSNIILSNLEFTPAEPTGTLPNASSKAALFISDSQDISLIDSHVHSRLVDAEMANEDLNLIEGLPFGFGVRISDSQDIVLSGNEINEVHKGIGLWNTENVDITNNHLHHIRVDGIVGTDQRDTLIFENLFESFTPYRKDEGEINGFTDDHSDMIQYWGATAEFGIDGFVVKDNVFIQLGTGNQTIYGSRKLRETDDSDAISFQNFEISGNLIYNGSKRAISLSDVTGAKVYDNTLIATEGVTDNFRDVPIITLQNSGPDADEKSFSLDDENVQRMRDVDVYNNVLTTAFDAEILLDAYDPSVNTLAQVEDALNIKIHSNSWISSRLDAAQDYEYVFKLGAESSEDGLNISLDNRAEDVHSDAGSKYYTDAEILQDFLAKLNTSRDVTVDTDLTSTDANGASLKLLEDGDIITNNAKSYIKIEEEEDTSDVRDSQQLFGGKEVEVNFGVGLLEEQVNLSGWTSSASDALAHVYDAYEEDDSVYLFIRVGTTIYEQEFTDLNFSVTQVILDLDESIRNGEADDSELTDALEELLENSVDDPPIQTLTLDQETSTAQEQEVVALQTPVAARALTVETPVEPEVVSVEPKVTLNAEVDKTTTTGEQTLVPAGGDKYTGGQGSDDLLGTSGRDFIDTRNGNDKVDAAGGNDTVFSGYGSDNVIGGDGRDLLNGGSGEDTLAGGTGNDTLIGGNNNDILIGGEGNDSISGSGGQDILVLAGDAEDFDIVLATNWDISVKNLKTGELDRVNLVEAIYFQGSDMLYNVDRHTGETTYIKPWHEKDLYTDLRSLPVEDPVYTSLELSQEQTTAHNIFDSLTAIGSDANEALDGNKSAGIIRGSDSNDMLTGNASKDRIRGDDGDDMILGGAGRDALVGHRGNDLLLGGSGNDFVSGASGNDIVVGGIGDDRLLGGSGIDTAVYSGDKTDYRISKINSTTYSVEDKETGETDTLVDVERIFFEESNLLGEIRNSGWVRQLNEKDHSEEYAAFDPANWANYTDEMVY